MNVREALECVPGYHEYHETVSDYQDDLAPIIERALRAAYGVGVADALLRVPMPDRDLSDNGVTAGVAAMMEES